MGVKSGPNYESFNVAKIYCGEHIAFVIDTGAGTSFGVRTSGTCTYIVDWGDESSETVNASGTYLKSHNYSVTGEYTVRIEVVSGEFRPYYYANSNGDLIRKIRGRHNYIFSGGWGNSFRNTGGNINEFTVNLSGVTSLDTAFAGNGALMNGFGVNDASELRGETLFNFKELSSCTSFSRAWDGCREFSSFPLLDVSSGTNFFNAWGYCTNLTSFPLLDVSSGTNFQEAWKVCTGLTSFPALDFSSATNFEEAWFYCTSLTTFPPNMFDNTGTLTNVSNAFRECALTAQSIENILVSFDTNGATGLSLGLHDGTNAGKSTWTSAANTAYTNLIGKSWTITYRA